ncbi:MAG: TVP38/TMEM64 family protein [Nitrospirota bacterium]|nr:TVP38/TMEM64 family protein [Nitrospirota bacterium]
MNKPQQNPATKSTGKWVLLALIVLGIAVFSFFDLGQYVTLASLKENKDALKTYTQENYVLTVILFILIYTLQTGLSLPGATILTLAGGFLYGTFFGALFVNVGATSGAVLAFMVSRYLLRDTIEKRFGKRLAGIQSGFTDNAFSYLLTLRLIPLFPFFLVNLASGMTRIKLSTYVITTAIGILPGSIVYTNAGKQLGQINSLKDIASPGVLGAFVLLGLLSLVPVFYNKYKKSSAAKDKVDVAKP